MPELYFLITIDKNVIKKTNIVDMKSKNGEFEKEEAK